jgi:hypothetical protein
MVIEVGKPERFPRKAADIYYPPDSAADFPVAMQVLLLLYYYFSRLTTPPPLSKKKKKNLNFTIFIKLLLGE